MYFGSGAITNSCFLVRNRSNLISSCNLLSAYSDFHIKAYHTSESKPDISASVSFTYFHTIAAKDSRSDGVAESSERCRALVIDWEDLAASDEFAIFNWPVV